jgi:hypothetical protein
VQRYSCNVLEVPEVPALHVGQAWTPVAVQRLYLFTTRCLVAIRDEGARWLLRSPLPPRVLILSHLCSSVMKDKRRSRETDDAASTLLKFTGASPDTFPPLKRVSGRALHISEMVHVRLSSALVWQVLTMSLEVQVEQEGLGRFWPVYQAYHRQRHRGSSRSKCTLGEGC